MHAISSRPSETPCSIRAPAPRLGQRSRAILGANGFSAAEVEHAVASGLVTAS